MYKTDSFRSSKCIAVGCVTAVSMFIHSASAQTIADLAERQRAKLLEASSTQLIAPSVVATPPQVKAPPANSWKLYGIHVVGNKMGAEVINDAQLFRVEKGSVLGNYKVVDVTYSSITIEMVRGCKRKCPVAKVVPVGEGF
jgi:hypothetical protein